MSKNRITGGDGFWVLMIALVCLIAYPKVFLGVVFFFGAAFAILAFIKHDNMPICPSCKNKGYLVYLHENIDGSPDRRYNSNPLVCPHCRKNPNTFLSMVHEQASVKKVVSCHYVSGSGMRKFADCPDYPKDIGVKCEKCWIRNDG
jgi:hypothetical protein